MKRRKERRRRRKDKRIEKWEKRGGIKVHTQEEAGRERKKEKEKAKSPPVASRPLSTHDVQFFSLSQN
jgi:hypothetical protein